MSARTHGDSSEYDHLVDGIADMRWGNNILEGLTAHEAAVERGETTIGADRRATIKKSVCACVATPTEARHSRLRGGTLRWQLPGERQSRMAAAFDTIALNNDGNYLSSLAAAV